MATKVCPNCGWRKDISTQVCHCGHDFTRTIETNLDEARQESESLFVSDESTERKSEFTWRGRMKWMMGMGGSDDWSVILNIRSGFFSGLGTGLLYFGLYALQGYFGENGILYLVTILILGVLGGVLGGILAGLSKRQIISRIMQVRPSLVTGAVFAFLAIHYFLGGY